MSQVKQRLPLFNLVGLQQRTLFPAASNLHTHWSFSHLCGLLGNYPSHYSARGHSIYWITGSVLKDSPLVWEPAALLQSNEQAFLFPDPVLSYTRRFFKKKSWKPLRNSDTTVKTESVLGSNVFADPVTDVEVAIAHQGTSDSSWKQAHYLSMGRTRATLVCVRVHHVSVPAHTEGLTHGVSSCST